MARERIQIDIEKVEALAAVGCSYEEICLNLRISSKTFYNKRKENPEITEAIKRGQAKGLATIENALFKKAKEGNVTAAIFYLVNRGNGKWRSINRTEITGADGTPLSPPALEIVFPNEKKD